MTDIALARKNACLKVVRAVLTDLIDDSNLIDAALRVADYEADDLEAGSPRRMLYYCCRGTNQGQSHDA
jgi:hypothetical protein